MATENTYPPLLPLRAKGAGIYNDNGRLVAACGDDIAYEGEAAHQEQFADLIVRAVNSHNDLLDAVTKLEEALRTDARDKSVTSDTVEYHLDGQVMYQAINAARRAIQRAKPIECAKAESKD